MTEWQLSIIIPPVPFIELCLRKEEEKLLWEIMMLGTTKKSVLCFTLEWWRAGCQPIWKPSPSELPILQWSVRLYSSPSSISSRRLSSLSSCSSSSYNLSSSSPSSISTGSSYSQYSYFARNSASELVLISSAETVSTLTWRTRSWSTGRVEGDRMLDSLWQPWMMSLQGWSLT